MHLLVDKTLHTDFVPRDGLGSQKHRVIVTVQFSVTVVQTKERQEVVVALGEPVVVVLGGLSGRPLKGFDEMVDEHLGKFHRFLSVTQLKTIPV